MPIINESDSVIAEINLIRVNKGIPPLKKATLVYEDMREQVKAAFNNEVKTLTEFSEIRQRKYTNYFESMVEFSLCNQKILEQEILFDPKYDHIALIDFEFGPKQFYYCIISSII